MAIIRLEALTALKVAIECAVPELKGQICVGQPFANRDQSFPAVSLYPVKWTYHPEQAEDRPGGGAQDRAVVAVGRHQSIIQIRIGAATPHKRDELEQKVLDLFLNTQLHPGVLLTPVLKCKALGEFLAAWELDEDEWDDDKAFDNQAWSQITCLGIIPALTTYGNAPTISEIQLGLTHEFGTTVTPATFNTDPTIEIVEVNEDGSITPVP